MSNTVAAVFSSFILSLCLSGYRFQWVAQFVTKVLWLWGVDTSEVLKCMPCYFTFIDTDKVQFCWWDLQWILAAVENLESIVQRQEIHPLSTILCWPQAVVVRIWDFTRVSYHFKLDAVLVFFFISFCFFVCLTNKGCWEDEVMQVVLKYLVLGNTEIRLDLINTLTDGKNVQFVDKVLHS